MSAIDLPDELRAITVLQPWASLIACGAKTVETRPRPTHHRGQVLVHAAARWTVEQFADNRFAVAAHLLAAGHAERWVERKQSHLSPGGQWHELMPDLPLGAMVAVASIVDCVPTDIVWPWADDDEQMGGEPLPPDAGWSWAGEPGDTVEGVLVTRREARFGDVSNGRWAYLLAGIRPLREPVPARGQPAVPWRVPDDVAAIVREQVEAVGS